MQLPIKQAIQQLSDQDPVLAVVIAHYNPPHFQPHTNYYQALVESIVGQQLSVKAAASIRKRFIGLFDDSFPTPEQIVGMSIEQLRTAGLSRAKATYIQDLAHHIINDTLDLTALDALSNDEIISKLTTVKGIGVWTVHMFLLFCMGRLDILPIGDLGVRTGIKNLYHLDSLPTPAEVERIATVHEWHPYESIAAWYIWQSLDNTPNDSSQTE